VSSTSLPEQLFRTQRFTLGVPGQFTVSRDGTVVLFLRSRTGEDRPGCLWALDVTSGTERLLADPAGLPGSCGPPPPAGIDGYAADLAAGLAAFTLAGELWTVEVGSGETRRLPARAGAAGPLPGRSHGAAQPARVLVVPGRMPPADRAGGFLGRRTALHRRPGAAGRATACRALSGGGRGR